jgi:hypothetical protein
MEDNGSLYDQFIGHSAPAIEQKAPLEREVNWQASNNERFKREIPNPVETEQKDESGMAFWRMFTQQIPKGSFEQSVNIRFGGREAIGEQFREKKIEYVKLYKSIMGEVK